MTAPSDWQGRVGDVWAAEWRRTDRSLAALACHLDAAIVAAAPDRGRVLDIGCGAGATSLALVTARPELAITGIDLSQPLVDVAIARACEAGLADRTSFAVGLVEELEAGSFDLLVSRHGVMFFADPVAAFARLRAAAHPGAPLVFSCFGPPAANRFATLADELAGTPTSPTNTAPGPFAFAEPDHVSAILSAAGWKPDSAARIDFAYRAGEGSDPVADAVDFLTRIGPVARLLRDTGPANRPALQSRLASALADHREGDAVDLPAQAWIWRATGA